MAAAAPSLAALPEACLLQVAATLPSRDLAALALAARRFGARRPAASSGGAPAEPLALAEEAARLRLLAEPADRRAQLPRDGAPPQPWPALLREREWLDAPLRFTRLGPRVALREGASVATRGGVTCHAGHRAALCGGRRLRAGRHYAELTLVDGKTELFGLCPAAFEPATGEAALPLARPARLPLAGPAPRRRHPGARQRRPPIRRLRQQPQPRGRLRQRQRLRGRAAG